MAIVEQFRKQVLFPVRLYQNEKNLRSTSNFANAISHCEGDVIVLSDQDDRWRPDKLQKFSELFSDSHADLVFTDAELIDAEGKLLGKRLWKALECGDQLAHSPTAAIFTDCY